MKKRSLKAEKLDSVRGSAGFTGVLAMTAGCVDAYAFITLGTYVSFMSGNTTQAGSELGQSHWDQAIPALIAIGSFVIGSILGHLLSHGESRTAPRVICGISASLLAGYLGLSESGVPDRPFAIALLAMSMGIMNAAASRVATQGVNLTFVTGTLNRTGHYLALMLRGSTLADAAGVRDTPLRRAMLLLGVWVSFLLGALVSGFLAPAFGALVLVVPLGILLVLAAFSNE